MIDITELVKRLRAGGFGREAKIEAADALEAQAKEIKIYQQTELTYVTRVADAQREYSEMQAKLKARIAELEALLKDCADDLEAEVDARYGETSKKCMPHRYERDMAPVVAARAKLNGEME